MLTTMGNESGMRGWASQSIRSGNMGKHPKAEQANQDRPGLTALTEAELEKVNGGRDTGVPLLNAARYALFQPTP